MNLITMINKQFSIFTIKKIFSKNRLWMNLANKMIFYVCSQKIIELNYIITVEFNAFEYFTIYLLNIFLRNSVQ